MQPIDVIIFVAAAATGALLARPISWLWSPPNDNVELRRGERRLFYGIGTAIVFFVFIAGSA